MNAHQRRLKARRQKRALERVGESYEAALRYPAWASRAVERILTEAIVARALR